LISCKHPPSPEDEKRPKIPTPTHQEVLDAIKSIESDVQKLVVQIVHSADIASIPITTAYVLHHFPFLYFNDYVKWMLMTLCGLVHLSSLLLLLLVCVPPFATTTTNNNNRQHLKIYHQMPTQLHHQQHHHYQMKLLALVLQLLVTDHHHHQ
jgi:hypothetical protein